MFNTQLLGSVVVCCAIASGALGQELRFEFTINSQISGSRPWDGTASSSSGVDGVLDGIGGGSILGGLAESVMGTAFDAAIDETQATIAPPDPYMCVIYDPVSRLATSYATVSAATLDIACTPRSQIQSDRTFFNLDIPSNYAVADMFGVALVDSDADQFGGSPASQSDETIGFGMFIAAGTFAQVQSRDALTMSRLESFEQAVTQVVDTTFGLTRVNAMLSANPTSSHALELEKLTVQRCSTGCRFGDATVTIRDSVGGY